MATTPTTPADEPLVTDAPLPRIWIHKDKEWTLVEYVTCRAAQVTFQWCTDFVVPLHLCPWALPSVSTPGALRIYVVDSSFKLETAVRQASRNLNTDVHAGRVDPNVAIAFCVVDESSSETNHEPRWEFEDFYEWFQDLEESYLFSENDDDDTLGEFVTLAPFHPDWHYNKGPPALNLEKQSPYPTVTVVCTSTIDRAGPEATDRIAHHNQQVLTDAGLSQLQHLYQTRVWQPTKGTTHE